MDTTTDTDTRPALYDNAPVLCPENQRVAVFNCANEELSPSCEAPGLRLIGFFATKEEAAQKVRWLQRRLDEDEQIDFWMTETMSPFLICRNHRRMLDPKYRQKKIDHIVAVRQDYLQARADEFEVHKDYVFDPLKEKEKKDTGAHIKNPFRQPPPKPGAKPKPKKTSSRHKALQAMRKKKAAEEPPVTVMHDYRRDLEIRDQEYAAISWLKDITPKALRGQDANEPLFTVYRCFSSEEEAMQWIQDVAMKQIDDPLVEIVRMYGWLHPTSIDYSKVAELYANQDLNKYMKKLNQEQKDSHSFEQWCLENKVPIPTISVEQLAKGEVKLPNADDMVEFFEKGESQIPDEEAVYVDVEPLSRQPDKCVKLKPRPKQKPKPRRLGPRTANVANKQL